MIIEIEQYLLIKLHLIYLEIRFIDGIKIVIDLSNNYLKIIKNNSIGRNFKKEKNTLVLLYQYYVYYRTNLSTA